MKKQIQTTKLIMILLILISSMTIQAQTGRGFGRVTDELSGEALTGANILVKGTSQGAASDIDGNYNIINVQPGTYTIVADVKCNAPTEKDLLHGPFKVEIVVN